MYLFYAYYAITVYNLLHVQILFIVEQLYHGFQQYLYNSLLQVLPVGPTVQLFSRILWKQ